MSDFQPEGRKNNARETRAETVRRERRFRGDEGIEGELKLHVPNELKKPGYTHRWVNDTAEGERVKRFESRDWDIVKDTRIEGAGEGTPVKRFTGKSENGAPVFAYLMEKPLEWHQEDQTRKNRPRRELEETMKRGPTPNTEGLAPNEAYVPAGHVNRIGQA